MSAEERVTQGVFGDKFKACKDGSDSAFLTAVEKSVSPVGGESTPGWTQELQ